MDVNENNIFLESEGSGLVYFNLREQFIERDESNSKMSMSMVSINVQAEANTVSNNQTIKE